MSKIEWTEKTWNPIVGCSVVSKGCKNCYAMAQANRLLDGNPNTPHYGGTTEKVNGNSVWTGKVALAPEFVLMQPLKRKKPTMYFVNSMGDLFHENVPDEWIDEVFGIMALCPQHTFQVLTKRPDRMKRYLNCETTGERILLRSCAYAPRNSTVRAGLPLHNVWLGVSAEDQETANARIPHLLETPAAVRFVSCEPLLGDIDLGSIHTVDGVCDSLDRQEAKEAGDEGACDGAILWVIAGGESGRNARPMHPDWVRSLRDQCVAADVPFFFKQWGEWGVKPHCFSGYAEAGRLKAMTCVSSTVNKHIGERTYHAGRGDDYPAETMRKFGKAKAGRELDGVTWDEMPKVQA